MSNKFNDIMLSLVLLLIGWCFVIPFTPIMELTEAHVRNFEYFIMFGLCGTMFLSASVITFIHTITNKEA